MTEIAEGGVKAMRIEYGGAIDISTSANVQYAYADGSANTIRPTGVVYPDGNALTGKVQNSKAAIHRIWVI